MQSKRRETLLKIAVAAIVGLWLLDRVVLSPAITHWKKQSERIATLREEVQRGRGLVERERSIRARWAEMFRTDLPDDPSSAESEVFKSIARWAQQSRVSFTSLSPDWREHEGYDTYECEAKAIGDQASLARLLYEIEADPLPAHVQNCEISAQNAQGKQLLLTLRFSFVRLAETGRNSR